MHIYKTKAFVRFARRERIMDRSLADAIRRAGRGQVDADLGGAILKQRVARPGQGRSGGYRVLIAYRPGVRAVFLSGFAKSERANITPKELATLQNVGALWLGASEQHIERALEEEILQEVGYVEDENEED